MNKATLKSRATLIGKVFAAKGITLTRAEQLDIVAQLEGARDWHHAGKETAAEARPPAPVPFTELQREAVKRYSCGEYANFGFENRGDVSGVSDTLFEFVLDEIKDAGDDQEEAVQLLRRAADDLMEVAAHLENCTAQPSAELAEVAKLHPTELLTRNWRGEQIDWNLRYVTCRFLQLQENLEETAPDLYAWARNQPVAFDLLAARCREEIAFIAELNGQRGVLYEVEIDTIESVHESEAVGRVGLISKNARREKLQLEVAELEARHPHLQFAIDSTWFGGFGVWAFSPEYSLLTHDQVTVLLSDLYQLY